jgi:hypothetical protein
MRMLVPFIASGLQTIRPLAYKHCSRGLQTPHRQGRKLYPRATSGQSSQLKVSAHRSPLAVKPSGVFLLCVSLMPRSTSADSATPHGHALFTSVNQHDSHRRLLKKAQKGRLFFPYSILLFHRAAVPASRMLKNRLLLIPGRGGDGAVAVSVNYSTA